jgi:hypothetical protein
VTKEQPVKAHDHGMDALRYLLHTLDAPGGRRGKPRRVRAAGLYAS